MSSKKKRKQMKQRYFRSGEFHWKPKESVAGKYWLWWCREHR